MNMIFPCTCTLYSCNVHINCLAEMFVLGEEIVQHPAVKIQLFIKKIYERQKRKETCFSVVQLQ